MQDKVKKILVVDNNPVILKLMEHFLKQHGHHVVCVSDEFGCIDTLVDMVPDIIFLDLIMPQISGADLCKIVRNIEALQDCYVVIVSAVAIEHDLDFLTIGADACIAKGPFKEMAKHVLQSIKDSEEPGERSRSNQIKGIDYYQPRQVTRELIQQNEHLRVMLESMSQGIIEINYERVIYINPQAVDIIGGVREELLGARVDNIFPGPLLQACMRQNSSEELYSQNNSLPIQIGSRHVILEQFAVKNDGENYIVILSDITERRRMESVIEASNLTDNLGYVFSGLRHEIGNPVNSIKVALSVLQSNLDEYDKETISEFIERSQQEISRIEYLLGALRNFSLFEKPVIQNVSLTDFIENFISLVRSDFEKKNIHIQTIFPVKNVEILVDDRALHHIMLNLLTNAADAVANLESPKLAISIMRHGKWVDIKVDDNGEGIPEADQENLFKPFFTSKITGTGLGLVIVKKMLTAMNGTIKIESYKGIGTTATITLPGLKNA